jgi:hypothetical protein
VNRVPTTRVSIRDAVTVVTTVMLTIVGTGLIVSPYPSFWFRTALGLLLYAQALRGFALAKAWARIRQELGLSIMRAMRLCFVAYIAAGCVFVIVAVSSLQPAVAAIVGFGALCWIWMWGWFLGQSGEWIEPNSAEADKVGTRLCQGRGLRTGVPLTSAGS